MLTIFVSEAQRSLPDLSVIVAPNRRHRATFARQAVFTEFGKRDARALDQSKFSDHSPDAQMRRAPGSWFQK